MAFEKETGDYGTALPFYFLHFHFFFHFWLKDALYLFFILLTLLFYSFRSSLKLFFFSFRFLHFLAFSCILEMSSDANPPIPPKSIFPPPFHYYYNNILRFSDAQKE